MPARPVPQHLRKLRGLPREGAPVTTCLQPLEPPSWLSEEAKIEWQRILEVTKDYPGWIQPADHAALAAYCATWVEAAKDVAKRGPLVLGRSSADGARGEGGLVKNPSLQIARDASATLRAWCIQLGFTPDSRGKIDVGDREDEDDEIACLLS